MARVAKMYTSRLAQLGWMVGVGVGVPGMGHSLAVSDLTAVTPPPLVSASFVRIQAGSDVSSLSFNGSGTIIGVHADESGPGGWLCVLTADHVISTNTGRLFGAYGIGFGDQGSGGLEYTSESGIMAFRGPSNGDGTIVDLGLLGVRIPVLSALPGMTIPSLGAVDDGDLVYLAGYGLPATLDGDNREYDVVEDMHGMLRAGFNGVDDQSERSFIWEANSYRQTSIHATTMFGPPAPEPAIQAEAHLLNGDSGGPTFQYLDSGFELVGVHSTSTINGLVGSRFVSEGDDWWDVNVASYRPWITSTCELVPEPTSMAAVGLGLVALLARRRSAKPGQ